MKTKKIVAKKVAAPKKALAKTTVAAKTKVDSSVKVNHIIPKALGMEMISRFKKNIKNLNKVKFDVGKEFDKSLFEALLKLKGLKNVRIYNAINADNSHTFVITGLDAKSNELYFKIKQIANAKKAVGKSLAQTADNDGVGNMGNQCTEPPSGVNAEPYLKL